MVECLDNTFSKCIDEAGPYSSFERMVIDVHMIPADVPICRIARASNTVLVRDDIKRSIVSARMTGCQFYSVELLHEVCDTTTG